MTATAAGSVDIPPAVPELQRVLALTRLVLAWGRARGSGPLAPGQAAPLAAALARFLDEVETEGSDFALLAELVPAHFAEHWQQVLDFLAILTAHWPAISPSSAGSIPPSAAISCCAPRPRLGAGSRRAGRSSPPASPAAFAAVAELLAVVALLPEGAVVLPGLDTAASRIGTRSPPTPRIRSICWDVAAAARGRAAAVRDWPAPGLTPGPASRRASSPRRCGRRRKAITGADLPASGPTRCRADAARLRRAAGRGGGDRAAAARSAAGAGQDRGAGDARSRPGAARRRRAAALGNRYRRSAPARRSTRRRPASSCAWCSISPPSNWRRCRCWRR